jgi:hypothetical protein
MEEEPQKAQNAQHFWNNPFCVLCALYGNVLRSVSRINLDGTRDEALIRARDEI